MYQKMYPFAHLIELKSCKYFNGSVSQQVHKRDLTKNYQSIKKDKEKTKAVCSVCKNETQYYSECDECGKIVCENCSILDIPSNKSLCNDCFNTLTSNEEYM